MNIRLLKFFLLLIIIFFLKEIEIVIYDLRLYISSLLKNKNNDNFIIIDIPYNYIGNNIVLINTIENLKKSKAIILDTTLIKNDNYFSELFNKISSKENIFLTKEYIYKNDNLYLFSNNYIENISGSSNYKNTVREFKKVNFNTLENELETSIEFIIYQKYYNNNKKEIPDSFNIRYNFLPNQIEKVNITDIQNKNFDNKIVFLSYNNNYLYFPFTKNKFLQAELFINNIISLEKNTYIKTLNTYIEIIITFTFAIYGYIQRQRIKKIINLLLLYLISNILIFIFFDLYINIIYILFSLFLFKIISPDNLSNIINKFNFKNKIKARNKTLTILFCDIEDFTLITEKLSNKKLLEILNDFLKSMTEIILNNNGNLDKYIGDGFMAFFDKPEDSINSAINMYNELEVLQKKWLELGIKPFQMRIGISTGEVILANIGHHNKIQSTVIGDPVNLASRLERLNKEYNTSILISKDTYENIKNNFNTKYLGKTYIKGKSEKVDIYEIKI